MSMTMNWSIKTRTGYTQKASNISKEFKKAVGEETANIGINYVLQYGAKALDIKLYVLATFIQRLASRTPIDEDYTYTGQSFDYALNLGTDGSGKTIYAKMGKSAVKKHKADKNYARYDWKISCSGKSGGKSVTSGELASQLNGGSIYYKENDQASIDLIYNQLKKDFVGLNSKDLSTLTVSNDNDHIEVLEYGGYKNESSLIKKGTIAEHGVKNHHSVQAPNGMLRISMLELQSIFAIQNSSRNIAKRYSRQSSKAFTSDATLKRLVNRLINAGGFSNFSAVLNTSLDGIMKNLKVSDI